MIRAFNAFQIVSLFAAAPFLLQWLFTSPFAYAAGAFWVGIVVYVVLFVGMIVSVHETWANP